MSLTRSLFNEFRPFFRMLEEPLTRPFPVLASRSNRHFLDHPFWSENAWPRPAVDLLEEGDKYIVEAELPGVKKDNIEVRVGDGGRSITIEGKIVRGTSQPAAQDAATAASTTQSTESTVAPSGKSLSDSPTDNLPGADSGLAEQSQQISTERTFSGTSTFTRTVWLPRPIDSSGVKAKLEDGVLTLTVPKAVEQGSTRINVD
jgi:HSP20 family molecular chaperone IbpA